MRFLQGFKDVYPETHRELGAGAGEPPASTKDVHDADVFAPKGLASPPVNAFEMALIGGVATFRRSMDVAKGDLLGDRWREGGGLDRSREGWDAGNTASDRGQLEAMFRGHEMSLQVLPRKRFVVDVAVH